jgi:nucleoside recognition membrane protein YjiH
VKLAVSLSGIARLLFLPLLFCSLLVEFCISAVVHAGVFAGVTVGFWLLFRFSADW